jgi:hypothetical protein
LVKYWCCNENFKVSSMVSSFCCGLFTIEIFHLHIFFQLVCARGITRVGIWCWNKFEWTCCQITPKWQAKRLSFFYRTINSYRNFDRN